MTRLISMVLLVLLTPVAVAQEQEVQEEQQQDPRDVRRRGQGSTAARISDDIMRRASTRFGCVLTAQEVYSTNVLGTNLLKEDDTITILSPRIFTNYGSARTRFHANYGYAYRFYNNYSKLNTDEQHLDVNYSVRLSRRRSFLLYERMDYMPNDSILLYEPGPSFRDTNVTPTYSYAYDFMKARQNVFRNDAALAMNFQIGRGGSLTTTGGYQSYRYAVDAASNASAAYGALSYSHRITRWLSFASTYTAYFAQTSPQFPDNQIHRVQVGEFSFRPSRTWKVWLAGGLDYAQESMYGSSQTAGTVSAGISHGTRRNVLELTYQRGLTTVFGLPGVYLVDSGRLSFVQRLAERTSFQASGYYQRGADYYSTGRLEHYAAIAGLEFRLRPDLVATANYAYRRQHSADPALGLWNFDRSVVYAGLVYFWPGE